MDKELQEIEENLNPSEKNGMNLKTVVWNYFLRN